MLELKAEYPSFKTFRNLRSASTYLHSSPFPASSFILFHSLPFSAPSKESQLNICSESRALPCICSSQAGFSHLCNWPAVNPCHFLQLLSMEAKLLPRLPVAQIGLWSVCGSVLCTRRKRIVWPGYSWKRVRKAAGVDICESHNKQQVIKPTEW